MTVPKNQGQILDGVRSRREALYEALIGLEDALSGAIGDGKRWRLRVAMAIDHAANRIDEHIVDSEGPDGLIARVTSDEPRLHRRAQGLRTDHEQLEKQIHTLKMTVADIGDDEIGERAIALRNDALEFLGRLAQHRQRGADLVYEAYQVDIGASH